MIKIARHTAAADAQPAKDKWYHFAPKIRYSVLGFTATMIIIAAMVSLASLLVEGWFQRDVELRTRLVFRTIRDQVIAGISAPPTYNLTPFFERLSEDERLTALAFCSSAGALLYATKDMPKEVSCDDLRLEKSDSFSTLHQNGKRSLLGMFPITAGTTAGHLLVVHDMSYIDHRRREAQFYITLALIGIAAGFGLLAMTVVQGLTRGWTRSILGAIDAARAGVGKDDHGASPVSKEVSAFLSEFRIERRFTEGIHVEWSPKTLHRLLEEELPGAQVIVVSNREPYIHNSSNGQCVLQIPASGLVAALEPVMRACGGTWIAHGSGSADRETVDAHDRIKVPPSDPSYTLRRVWLSDDEQDGYYYGFANEGVWPLCHIAFVRPTFREQDWAYYTSVNKRFADVVVDEATSDNPIVLVQDYHFGLLPRMIRQRLPRATIITFWHIPWPNAETFSICPWRKEIIDGLLGSTILGFHTQFHCNNFLEGVDRFVESRIDRENASITFGGHETLVRSYPISIAWPPAALAAQASVTECRSAVRQRYRLSDEVRIAVGIERFDYTKGILDRMRAVDDLLIRQPEWRGKFVFIQAAAPTRGKLGAYVVLQEEARRLASDINTRHGSSTYTPINLVIRHHEPHEVYELFRAADMCVVSSLHDGMNLVAKEFIASRDDEAGILILSSFAGASRELSEALMVNPYDTHGMAEAFASALRMSIQEQRERMRLMRDLVRQRNVYRWAAQMLLDAAWLRRREKVVDMSRDVVG